jgi:ABC-type cobalamin/Fe3+-siderophores transport system ATPase subunit
VPDAVEARYDPALRLESVSVALNGRPVLVDVTADVPAQRITVVAGPSGSGKTTLLRLCNRLAVPDRGRVLVGGADTAALEPRPR